MKLQQEQLEELLGVLLQHQPLIDATYDQLNSVAIALIREGYGNISEYKAEIETLQNKLSEKDVIIQQTQSNYDNAFERLKSQQQEIDRLKRGTKQARIDVLVEARKRLLPFGKSDVVFPEMIDDLIAEVAKEK